MVLCGKFVSRWRGGLVKKKIGWLVSMRYLLYLVVRSIVDVIDVVLVGVGR